MTTCRNDPKGTIMKKIITYLALAVVALITLATASYALPRPVRLAITAATGSGTEQQVVDSITSRLQENQYIVISTVNPDWNVSCRVDDNTDFASMNVRVNGTVTIKTAKDGAVINTISAQANKQDFSASGTAPVNKALITSAMREVIQELSQRSIQPIEQAVVTEIDTREKIEKAKSLAHEEKYDEALETVMMITRDSPHFWPAHALADQIQMEKDARNLVNQAKAKARQGQYRQAIVDLRQVNSKSKRYPTAQGLIATYSHNTLAKNKTAAAPKAADATNAQLKALAAERRALELKRQAIDAQEAAIRSTQPINR